MKHVLNVQSTSALYPERSRKSQWHPAMVSFTCRFAEAAPTGFVHGKQL